MDRLVFRGLCKVICASPSTTGFRYGRVDGTMTLMQTPQSIITLLTDFGENDAYVGAMKGVILSISPHVQLVDISHQVTPQDIRQAASMLASVYTYYPPQTVHLAVVDPGVGSARQPIALETPRGIFVAPDNGLLTFIRLSEPSSTPVLLKDSSYWLPSPSNTFHGRDIFSPAAAHLANGISIYKLGPVLEAIVMLSLPILEITPTTIRGEVVQADRFGNLLTSIRRLRWINSEYLEFQTPGEDAAPLRFDAARTRVTCGWHAVKGIQQTYSQVVPGQAVAIVGSDGELEIAVNQGNAGDTLSIQVGAPVTLHLEQ
jgi:S-adenosylmethionine hydrolase